MKQEIKLYPPATGIDVDDIFVDKWYINDGQYIEAQQVICILENKKATVDFFVEQPGKITILKNEKSLFSNNEPFAVLECDYTPTKEDLDNNKNLEFIVRLSKKDCEIIHESHDGNLEDWIQNLVNKEIEKKKHF